MKATYVYSLVNDDNDNFSSNNSKHSGSTVIRILCNYESRVNQPISQATYLCRVLRKIKNGGGGG